ncbi:MAG TPA: hypothetical protein VHK91_05405, partial [Flavisolibacter sp.]|nr:hypothetical protein [Flavisolibacter sp.]
IESHRELLEFLEKADLDYRKMKGAEALLYDPYFTQEFSSFFAYSFNQLSNDLLKQQAYWDLDLLLEFQNCILPEYVPEAYRKILAYIEDLLYMLRNLSWEKFSEDESILDFIFESGWIGFMNKLPSGFSSHRDEIVEQLIAVSLRFQFKASWRYLHSIMEALGKLEKNEFNQAEIERIDEVFQKNISVRFGKTTVNTDSGAGRYVGIIIWFIIMAIIRSTSCNSDRSTLADLKPITFISDNEINTTEQQNERKFISFLDSLNTGKQSQAVTREASFTGMQPFRDIGDDPLAARVDSLTVNNQSGYDVVYLYFKDVPGHHLSGIMTKLYSTYIKNGDARKVYIQPDNGRTYFLLGEDWGKLKKPEELSYTNEDGKVTQSFVIDHFFRKQFTLKQPYLSRPIFIDKSTTIRTLSGYQNLNYGNDSNIITILDLVRENNIVKLEARGKLVVKSSVASLSVPDSTNLKHP